MIAAAEAKARERGAESRMELIAAANVSVEELTLGEGSLERFIQLGRNCVIPIFFARLKRDAQLPVFGVVLDEADYC